MTSIRRLALTASAISTLAAALLLVAPSAQAAVVDLSTCNSNALSQPFLPWADPTSYELAPGGRRRRLSRFLAGLPNSETSSLILQQPAS